MSPEILIAFIVACILLGLAPGPNMALILANTLSHGLAAGLVTLAGTSTGLAILVAGAALGMSSLMVFMSQWFDVIRWIGALYLVYLGARQLWLLRRRGLRRFAFTRRPGAGDGTKAVGVAGVRPLA
jgi:homoserine/homoserine lactone efflux protein